MREIINAMLIIGLTVTMGCTGHDPQASDDLALLRNDSEGAAGVAEAELATTTLDRYEDRVAVLRAHCRRPNALNAGWIVEFDRKGERAPIEEIPCSNALEVAAAAYAAYSLDFDVSLGEVIEAGFWPYDVIPGSISTDLKLYGFKGHYAIANGTEFHPLWGSRIGSPEWLIECKAWILGAFYRDYYYDSRLKAPRAMLDAGGHDAFWYNDIAGRSMQVSEADGDMTTVALEALWMPGDPGFLSYDFSVPQVNVPLSGWAEEEPAGDVAPGMSKGASTTEDCCLFVHKQLIYDSGEHGWGPVEICCPCTETAEWCCRFSWVVDGISFKSWWEFVQCVPCDSTAPDGYTIRENGQRAPDTSWGWLGTLVSFEADCDPPMPCLITDEYLECMNEMDNFASSVTAGGIAHRPGPECTQCGGGTSSLRHPCCRPGA